MVDNRYKPFASQQPSQRSGSFGSRDVVEDKASTGLQNTRNAMQGKLGGGSRANRGYAPIQRRNIDAQRVSMRNSRSPNRSGPFVPDLGPGESGRDVIRHDDDPRMRTLPDRNPYPRGGRDGRYGDLRPRRGRGRRDPYAYGRGRGGRAGYRPTVPGRMPPELIGAPPPGTRLPPRPNPGPYPTPYPTNPYPRQPMPYPGRGDRPNPGLPIRGQRPQPIRDDRYRPQPVPDNRYRLEPELQYSIQDQYNRPVIRR